MNENEEYKIYGPSISLMDLKTKRDFRLHALPRNTEGEVLYADSSETSFYAYVRWLAGYLRDVELPEDIADDPFYEEFREGDLLSQAFYSAFEIVLHGHQVDEANQYEDFMKFFGDLINGDPDEDDPDALPEDVRKRLLAEEEERKRVLGEYANYAVDLGWRIPLAILVKRAENLEEAIEVLRQFYQGYNEWGSK